MGETTVWSISRLVSPPLLHARRRCGSYLSAALSCLIVRILPGSRSVFRIHRAASTSASRSSRRAFRSYGGFWTYAGLAAKARRRSGGGHKATASGVLTRCGAMGAVSGSLPSGPPMVAAHGLGGAGPGVRGSCVLGLWAAPVRLRGPACGRGSDRSGRIGAPSRGSRSLARAPKDTPRSRRIGAAFISGHPRVCFRARASAAVGPSPRRRSRRMPSPRGASGRGGSGPGTV